MARLKKELDAKLRREAKNRCGYCLNPQELMPYKLEIEHIFPQSLGGESTEENLWLACRECNAHKAAKIKAIGNLEGKPAKILRKLIVWLEQIRLGLEWFLNLNQAPLFIKS
jgi:5-methylcytosine-specific restriction endonuclease McrA